MLISSCCISCFLEVTTQDPSKSNKVFDMAPFLNTEALTIPCSPLWNTLFSFSLFSRFSQSNHFFKQ